MKKILIAFGLLLTFLIPAKRAFCDYDVATTKRDKGVWVRSVFDAPAGVSSTTILIDLSNTTTWPHKENGEIRLDNIDLEFDKPVASSGTVKIGVVTSVLTTSGTITWVYGRSISSSTTNNETIRTTNLDSGSIRCRVNPDSRIGFGYAGLTPYVITNDLSGFTTVLSTSARLNAVSGTAFPEVGDIVMQTTNQDVLSTIRVIVAMLYHSIPR